VSNRKGVGGLPVGGSQFNVKPIRVIADGEVPKSPPQKTNPNHSRQPLKTFAVNGDSGKLNSKSKLLQSI